MAKKETNDLLSVYGARKTKNVNYYNLSLLRGEDDKKEWFTASIKAENTKEKDGYLWVRVKLLQPSKKVTEEELPF